ncbi:MAG: ATPase [Opitutaceae bacterium]|nr:ATPase [Opitutaceae bacterium]
MTFKIGIDGGGTKTEFILVDASGASVARRTAAGCSPSLTARADIHRLITDNLHELIASAQNPTISHTVLCMAGSRLFWREFATELHGLGVVHAFDDSIPVLELATGGQPGLVLHVGTGSFVAARGLDGSAHYAGGLGWRFGDGGSAHDLGRRAVARALLELQGWAEPSTLGHAVCDQVKLHETNALLRHFYAPTTPPGAVAELAPLVTQYAAAHSPEAAAILTDSVREHAQLALTVSQRLFGLSPVQPLPTGLSGVILQSPLAQRTIAESLGSAHQLKFITDPPIEGVRRLLVRL